MLLLVGTQLLGIITRMCLDSHDKSQVVRGTFLVRPSDHFFWFGRPKLLLHLMHFILFQVNSFKSLISSIIPFWLLSKLNFYLNSHMPRSKECFWALQNSFQLAFFTWTWVSIDLSVILAITLFFFLSFLTLLKKCSTNLD